MPGDIAALIDVEPSALEDPSALWLAYVYCYDQRGGGVETSFKQDNQAWLTDKTIQQHTGTFVF